MLTIKELIIYALFAYPIRTNLGDDLTEVVPDCPEVAKNVKNISEFYRIYAFIAETDDEYKFATGMIDKMELKLYTYVYYTEYGTYVKNGHKQDGMIGKIKMIVYSLDGKKQKTRTWKSKN